MPYSTDPIEFGTYLRHLRMSRNLSLSQASLYSGVSKSYLSLIENGKRGVPTADVLKKLANIYNIDHVELLKFAGIIEINDNETNYVAEAELEYIANPDNTKKKFLYELLKKMQELEIIDEKGNKILDEETAEFILKDIESKVAMIKKMKKNNKKTTE